MEGLLKPEWGLIFWTVVNFLILAFLLAKFAWKPVIAALEARENKIASDIENARKANEDAQKIRAELQAKIDEIAADSMAKIQQAAALGAQEKQKILEGARKEAQALIEQAKQDIEIQTGKAVEALRAEIGAAAMVAVKKIIDKEADAKTSAKLVDDFLKDIKKK